MDSRERTKLETECEEQLCAFIDNDILEQVDAEGGITRAGRIYKAACLMERTRRNLTQVLDPNAQGTKNMMRWRAENRA
jgi:hypothetical protein